jgi:hypothetical protein
MAHGVMVLPASNLRKRGKELFPTICSSDAACSR